jgi:hypothetical protein
MGPTPRTLASSVWPMPSIQRSGAHSNRVTELTTSLRTNRAVPRSSLRQGQAAGLVGEVAERARQFQRFGGEDAGGLNAAGVFGAPSQKPR